MTRELIGFALVALVLVIANLTWLSISRRRKLQEAEIPALVLATATGEFECLYVSTVFEANPLERVWARGLGIRGKALVTCSNDGVSIHRQGETSFLITKNAFLGVSMGQATIDKGVEKDGLVQIHWLHGQSNIMTVLRFANPQTRKKFESKLQTMIGAKLG